MTPKIRATHDIMDTDPIGGRRSAVGGLIVPEFQQVPAAFQLPASTQKIPLHLRRHLLPHLPRTEGRTSVSRQQQLHLHVASQVISTWHSYSYVLRTPTVHLPSPISQKPTISHQPWPPSLPPTEPFHQHLGHDDAPNDSHSTILRYYGGILSIFRLVLERRSSYAAGSFTATCPTPLPT